MSCTISGPLDGEFRWSCTVGPDRPSGDDLDRLLAGLVAEVAAAGGGPTQLWVESVDDAASRAADRHAFTPYRDLLQLRVELPTEPTDLPVRSFTEADVDVFLAVNNRAFHWHPEQGGWTPEDLAARQLEPWYESEGFLLHYDGDRLLGFCWTKIHRDVDPHLGEIYVIGVDPAAHGRGLGRALTLAGLQWLSGRGLRIGMLFVESDNDAALRTYDRIGFVPYAINRAYRRTIEAAET